MAGQKDTNRERTCKAKKRHNCISMARYEKHSLARRTGDKNLVVYSCMYCKGYHIGHSKQKTGVIMELSREVVKHQDKMDVVDVATILGVTSEAIKKHVRVLYPEIIKNGMKTFLTEDQVTEIKKRMVPTTQVVASKTSLEENDIVLNAMEILVRRKKDLEQKVIQLETKVLEMKPKEEFFDAVTGSKNLISMQEVAKVLAIKGLGRNNLFELLREQKILFGKNQPYQQYVDRGYFKIIETRWEKNGDIQVSLKTMVSQRGLDFIRKTIEKVGV